MALDEARRTKVDRDEVFLEYTKSICPVCKTVIDGEVNVKDNKVFLRKRCAEPRRAPSRLLVREADYPLRCARAAHRFQRLRSA